VAVRYSMTTTQGWVTLLSADRIESLAANSQFVDAVPAPASRQGQFLVPLGPGASARFYKVLLEPLPSYLFNYPDLSDIIPLGQISIAGSGTNRMFQYTHDTFNGGSGPLEIQPVYNPASGNYQGYQHIFFYQGSGVWNLVRYIPVAGAFVFDAAHGHFHFPFASYGLYAANPDESIGPPVALSTKTGFCIADSFIYDPSLTNAGAFGNWGSCSDPTSLRGLSIGAVDEYDQTDEGQAIAIGNLPNGRYWLRSIVDPYNYLAESNETNNETDVEVAIIGSSVQVLQSVHAVLSIPPKISLTSPNAGSVTGVVTLTASTPVVGGSGVQFLVDGLPFGNPVAGPDFTLAWDTGSVPNGTHWLAARVADATGHFGTAPVIIVTVTNQSTVPPTVRLTSPDTGSIVSAVITVSANAAAQSGVPSVQFYVDGTALGAQVTSPPFMTSWDTETLAAGPHTLTASATDQGGLSSTSAPVVVTVDNSHPPNRIGIDVTVRRYSADVMQTVPFSTATSSDLVVAFVGYDGPDNTPQTATVTGAGLTWQLAKRSNAQNGTAEIWFAKATDFLSSVTVRAQPGIGGYHGLLVVLAFTNAAGPGIVGQASAPSGAPDIYLPGVFAGNWVFAVGNDWDNAIYRTPVSGQVLVDQQLDASTGDSYWVQSTAAPSAAGGLVDIHDNAPLTDRWNYAAVEIVATRQ
jgi:Bacterial Ig domain/Lysyl oxidase